MKKGFTFLYLMFVFLMFFRLGNSMFNADAHFWYQRTLGFIEAVKRFKWDETYQNPKPGVTVMWLSGIFMEAFFALCQVKLGHRPNLYDFKTFPYLHFSVKFPLVILACAFILYFYLFIKNNVGSKFAFFTFLFLAFQPFYIGVARYFHADGTLTVFMTLSALFLYLRVANDMSAKYLALSGLCGGLAFLTKMQGFFNVFFTVFLYLVLLVNGKKGLKRAFVDLVIWGVFALVAVFIFFPAMWVRPAYVVSDMFREASVVAEVGKNGGTGSALVYFRSVSKIVTPTLLIFSVVGGVVLCFSLYRKMKNHETTFALYSLFFVFWYFVQMLFIFQKSERYLLPIFPWMAYLASFGFAWFLGVCSSGFLREYFHMQIKTSVCKVIKSVLVFSVVTLSTFPPIYLVPHYTALSEEEPWGAVYSEAAKYLNNKENAADLKVVATPKEHTFKPFFKGKTYGKDEILPGSWTADYVVAAPGYLPTKYNYCSLEKDVVFRSIVYWKVYKCK